jgi:hypothetical protein
VTPRRVRQLRRICVSHGHAWHPVHPYSPVLAMGRWRCYRCHRYAWLTDQQVTAGHRRLPGDAYDQDAPWTAPKIRYRVTEWANLTRRRYRGQQDAAV